MRAPRRLIGVCAVVLCVVVAGCGGGDDEAKRDQAYISSVNTAMQRFASAAKKLPSGFKTGTLHTYSAALDQAATNLRRIDPPASVASLHQRLASDVSGYADAIDQAAKAPLSADPDRVVAAQQALVKATRSANTDVTRTLTAIGRRLDAQA
jgi:hypothetical protein